MARTKTNKNIKVSVDGVLKMDWLNWEIPVFHEDKKRIASLSLKGYEPEPVPPTVLGAMTKDYHPTTGNILLCLLLPIDSTPSTWVHEISHLVDFMMDHVGMEPDVSNTETRAYMTQHLFDQLIVLMTKPRKRKSR